MVSNNVWVEAPLADKSVKEITNHLRVARPDKLHITLVFTTLKADELTFANVQELREKFHAAIRPLPDLGRVDVTGSAVLKGSDVDSGVLLVNSPELWQHHVALVEVLEDGRLVDDKYPGFLPHITVAEGSSSRGEMIQVTAQGLRQLQLDGLYLRAGRISVPLLG